MTDRFAEKLFVAAIENAYDAVYIIKDAQTPFIYVNQAACTMLGYTREALLQMRVQDIDPIVSKEDLEASFSITYPTFSFETIHKTKNGVRINVEVTAAIFEYEEISYRITTAKNITHHKRLVAQLKQQEQLFRTLVEKSSDTIARYDQDGVRIYANPAFIASMGVDDVLGKKPSSDAKTIEMMNFELQLLEAIHEDREMEVEVSWHDHHNILHTSQVQIVPEKDENGRVVSALTTGRDITPFKESQRRLIENESRLKEAQRIAKMGSWELDHISGMIHLSEEARKILGCDTTQNQIGLKAYLRRICTDERRVVVAQFEKTLKERQVFRSVHAIEILKEKRYVSLIGETLFNAYGVAQLTRGTLQDITEKIQSEQKIKKQEEQMVMQSRLAQMGEMLSMIAHQWRQPLGAIGSTVLTLQTKLQSGELTYEYTNKEPEYLENRLERINDYVNHLTTTVEDFRSFFKPNRDKAHFNLKDIVEKAIDMLSGSLENYRIEIVRAYHVEGAVESYRNELIQVLMSLLNNAKDVLADRKIVNPEIMIELDQVENLYILSIHDNAGGIDETIIDKVFDPYFSTKGNTGMGLGLYMTKIIIETHCKGNIFVQNSESGAEFSMILPAI